MGQLDLAVLTGLRLAALAAQQLHHQLLTIADAQHGDTQLKQGLVHHGGVGLEHRGRTAGEDQGIWPEGADLVHGQAEGLDLTVDAAFTDTAGYQQIILAAKVQYQNLLHVSYPPGNGSHRPQHCR